MKFKYTVKLDGRILPFYGDSTNCLPFGARILTIDKLSAYK